MSSQVRQAEERVKTDQLDIRGGIRNYGQLSEQVSDGRTRYDECVLEMMELEVKVSQDVERRGGIKDQIVT